jgi:hypothetical protein
MKLPSLLLLCALLTGAAIAADDPAILVNEFI